jgi:hypothetical protein
MAAISYSHDYYVWNNGKGNARNEWLWDGYAPTNDEWAIYDAWYDVIYV